MKQRTKFSDAERLLISRASAILEGLNAVDREVLLAFRRDPGTTLFDRATAFLTFPFDAELRAALERLESGSYGRCTLCREAIGMSELMASPLGRYCSRCLARPRTGLRLDGEGLRAPQRVTEPFDR